MQTGVLTIGPLTLNESNILQDSMSSDARGLQLGSRESSCDTATIDILKDNIMSLLGRIMPVQFQYKNSYNGYYVVTDVNVDYDKWYQGSTLVQWGMGLTYVGPDNAVDIESRLANVVRSNNFSLAGERWHAPAVGHYGYFVGAVAPSSITRQGEGVAITVYRGIPASVNPRWGSPVSSFTSGAVRFLDTGTERISVRQKTPTTGWELNNSLVRVRPATTAGTTLAVAFYDGTVWREKSWDIRVGGGTTLVPSTHFSSVTLTRADPEAASVRITAKDTTNNTRVIVDLLLRRGSRFIEGYVQTAVSGTISVQLDVLETFNAPTGGYTIATAADAAGIKSVAGSSKTFTAATNGGVSASSVTARDFWIGAELTGAASGDLAADLSQQYIGAMAEKTGVARR